MPDSGKTREQLLAELLELRSSERLRRKLAAVSCDFTHACEREGLEPFRVTWLGGAYEKVTGYNSLEILTTGCWLTFVHQEDQERVGAHLMRLKAGDAGEIEFRLIHKDGGVRHVRETYLCEQGEHVHQLRLYGSINDITERTRMQELMVQTEKMMSVGGLAAGMAHEINNPLSGILQSIQVIMRRLGEPNGPNAMAARESGCTLDSVTGYMERRGILTGLNSIRESSVRVAQVVRNMLEFSRRSESTNAPADINDLLEKTVELYSTDYDLNNKYDFRNIRLERRFESGLPQVPCSRTQIQQVIMNLLGNAAYALRGTPQPAIVLRTLLDGDAVRIEVQDNGPGMDEPTRRKIFEPFFTTKPVGSGTGLGLSVSYFIVTNNHKGSIEVDSSPGNGARFIIRLPLSRGGSAGFEQHPDHC
ncbi:sensor histidine kinase [Fundidesulfovibrio soli]|uniref:sensor histidine kinase n=1 Tax=Fundidesulfovibrio soli TaxID=2922716 RepID=UPI001FAE9BF8|nr:PAS domain-containing sensor histidine kinase [Fundidesulfovibrio soli]